MIATTTEKLYEYFEKSSCLVTDTRKIKNRCIFFALKGDRFNGNQFADEALSKGAAYVVVDEEGVVKGDRYIYVEDALKALQELAHYHRMKFDIPVLAITGSNGKTTTKELVASVLSTTYKTHYTRGNFNNHIGLPLTLLEMPMDTEFAVIEMGANHQKEIAFLCQIAAPNYGLVTNIGKAHLEGFGGIEGVKKGKGELYDYLSHHDKIAFVNKDESFLTDLSKEVKHSVFYTKSDNASENIDDVATELITTDPVLTVAFLDRERKRIEINTNLIGTHNFNNIMTAICIGKYFNVEGKNIKVSIEKYIPKNNRSEVRKIGTNTFILDAYNANPTSTIAAVNYFDSLEASDKILVLGDMLELGVHSEVEHRRIVDKVSSFQNISVVFVGDEYANVLRSEDNCLHFNNVNEYCEWLKISPFSNNTILLKGSRGIGLEKILDTIV